MIVPQVTVIYCFLVILFFVSYSEAQTCKTPNGEFANCQRLEHCRILFNSLRDIRDRVASDPANKIKFLQQSQCGLNRPVLVCCGSHDNFQKNGNIFTRNSLLPDRSSCGYQKATNKILGGEETEVDEFPWMALLQYKKRDGSLSFLCGGTLISPKFVLTAAHCVTGKITNNGRKLVNARLGEWDTDTNPDCKNEVCGETPVDFAVEQSVYHPDYNAILNENDIALIKLKRNVQFTEYIQPICLPHPTERGRVGNKLTTAGWGRTGFSQWESKSSVKLKVEVPIVETSKCSLQFRNFGVEITDKQLCAGGQNKKDTCQGDSGGPLMNVARNDSSQWYIEGIVSFGKGCGDAGWPGVYTRVSAYLDWINNNITP